MCCLSQGHEIIGINMQAGTHNNPSLSRFYDLTIRFCQDFKDKNIFS